MFRTAAPQDQTALTIRRLGGTDAADLERLAQRDSAETPAGTVYGAVGPDGSLLAAISLESRDLVADPFRPTASAANLLRVWAGQLDGSSRPGWARVPVALAPASAEAASGC
jgi:hypothetical protein